MDRTVAESAIKMFLKEMRLKLDEAASVAKAAEVCAEGGNVSKAVEIVLDVEQLNYETSNLLNAAKISWNCSMKNPDRNGEKRFYHVSTDEVYGELHNPDEFFLETTSYDPRSPYSASVRIRVLQRR